MSDNENVGVIKQWYAVSTSNGHERKVANNLEKRRESQNMQDYIFRIVVAETMEPVLKNGKPTGKEKPKNLYPSYVFVEMIMTDDAWYVVRNTPEVTGFVGSSGKGTKPFPISMDEMEPILKRMNIIDENMFSDYKEGDTAKVISGTFEGLTGPIVSVDRENKKVQLTVSFFGRPTSIDADFSEIEKID